MSALNIETLSVPKAIKAKMGDLAATIDFSKESRKGSNGWLFFGSHRLLKQQVAVKFCHWSGDPAYLAEPQYLASLDAPNVVSVIDAAFVDGEYVYFLTPFYQRGDLDDEMRRGIHGNLRALEFARDILAGLSHLHANRLLHRDLKPQNILLSDDDHAVIGDFGSVKKMPEATSIVPGSGHSLLYRPPESIVRSEYGTPGDIYQVGLVLYQLLGGSLPYEETAWLNATQLRAYALIEDPIDRQLYANDAIKSRIQRGRVADLASLPPWVGKPLKSVIAKACRVDPEQRVGSCSELLAVISSVRPKVFDWRLDQGHPTCVGTLKFRLVKDLGTEAYQVEKWKHGPWRRDNSFTEASLADCVKEVERRLS